MKDTPDFVTIGERTFKELYDEFKKNFDEAFQSYIDAYAECPEDYEGYSLVDFVEDFKEWIYDEPFG